MDVEKLNNFSDSHFSQSLNAKKLKWCCKQSAGLRIDETNDNLAKEYLQSAEETLSVLKDIKGM